MKINTFSAGTVFKWTKEYLIRVLTQARKPIVTDPMIVNALNKIDRKDFLPDTLKSQAYNDVELDIGYSQVLNKPTVIAQMIAVLKPKFGGRYLDIGTGTGYSAMLLAFIAGDEGHVYSMERVQWIWEQASLYARKYPSIKNIDFLYKDGIDGLPQKAPFDGIHVAFALDTIPESLKMQLKVNGGRLVCPTTDMNLKVVERKGIDQYEEEIVPGFIFDKVQHGLA